jgi:hypothetical protein
LHLIGPFFHEAKSICDPLFSSQPLPWWLVLLPHQHRNATVGEQIHLPAHQWPLEPEFLRELSAQQQMIQVSLHVTLATAAHSTLSMERSVVVLDAHPRMDFDDKEWMRD